MADSTDPLGSALSGGDPSALLPLLLTSQLGSSTPSDDPATAGALTGLAQIAQGPADPRERRSPIQQIAGAFMPFLAMRQATAQAKQKQELDKVKVLATVMTMAKTFTDAEIAHMKLDLAQHPERAPMLKLIDALKTPGGALPTGVKVAQKDPITGTTVTVGGTTGQPSEYKDWRAGFERNFAAQYGRPPNEAEVGAAAEDRHQKRAQEQRDLIMKSSEAVYEAHKKADEEARLNKYVTETPKMLGYDPKTGEIAYQATNRDVTEHKAVALDPAQQGTFQSAQDAADNLRELQKSVNTLLPHQGSQGVAGQAAMSEARSVYGGVAGSTGNQAWADFDRRANFTKYPIMTATQKNAMRIAESRDFPDVTRKDSIESASSAINMFWNRLVKSVKVHGFDPSVLGPKPEATPAKGELPGSVTGGSFADTPAAAALKQGAATAEAVAGRPGDFQVPPGKEDAVRKDMADLRKAGIGTWEEQSKILMERYGEAQ